MGLLQPTDMVSTDQAVDRRTFRVSFSADGLVLLKDRLDAKLKEFLGDCTDDSLVEYVTVLIRNGRPKEEAKSELDVFLGDDSDSFVSWLWDHLTSNIDLYVESQKPIPDKTLQSKATSAGLDGTDISCQIGSEKEQTQFDKAFEKRHNRKWGALPRNEPQQPSLHSYVVDKVEFERKAPGIVRHRKRSFPHNFPARRKRIRANEHQNKDADETPKPTMSAPRRLLQFAVRDALAPTRPSRSLKKPKSRFSMLSTPSGDSAQKDQTNIIKSVARVPNTIAVGGKVAAEVAEDVGKARSTRNVFHRLDRGVVAPEIVDEVALINASPGLYGDCYNQKAEIQQMDYYQPSVDDEVDYYHSLENRQMHVEQGGYVSKYIENDVYSDYYRQKEEMQQMDHYHCSDKSNQMDVEHHDYSGGYTGNAIVLQCGTGLASYYASHGEGYDGTNVMDGRRTGITQTSSSRRRKRDNSLLVQHSMAQKADQVFNRTQLKGKDSPASAASASRKILNISVNVNTWKPPQYQPAIDSVKPGTGKLLQRDEAGVGKSSVWFMKENSNSLVPNGNFAIQRLTETQKVKTSGPGLCSAGRPLEDADARTIIVNNVHFAASKDSLCRHFNKFGEVLEVVILTDAATGRPKGSAFVEFMCKDAAENALTLDGTSFMSRILKVVKKSSVHKEESTATSSSRRVPFCGARFSWAPFSGVFPGAPVPIGHALHTKPD